VDKEKNRQLYNAVYSLRHILMDPDDTTLTAEQKNELKNKWATTT
jgi:hypothetical protein